VVGAARTSIQRSGWWWWGTAVVVVANLGPRGTSSVTGVVLSVVGRATEELGQGGLSLRVLAMGKEVLVSWGYGTSREWRRRTGFVEILWSGDFGFDKRRERSLGWVVLPSWSFGPGVVQNCGRVPWFLGAVLYSCVWLICRILAMYICHSILFEIRFTVLIALTWTNTWTWVPLAGEQLPWKIAHTPSRPTSFQFQIVLSEGGQKGGDGVGGDSGGDRSTETYR
jgi:hypothetical protein